MLSKGPAKDSAGTRGARIPDVKNGKPAHPPAKSEVGAVPSTTSGRAIPAKPKASSRAAAGHTVDRKALKPLSQNFKPIPTPHIKPRPLPVPSIRPTSLPTNPKQISKLSATSKPTRPASTQIESSPGYARQTFSSASRSGSDSSLHARRRSASPPPSPVKPNTFGKTIPRSARSKNLSAPPPPVREPVIRTSKVSISPGRVSAPLSKAVGRETATKEVKIVSKAPRASPTKVTITKSKIGDISRPVRPANNHKAVTKPVHIANPDTEDYAPVQTDAVQRLDVAVAQDTDQAASEEIRVVDPAVEVTAHVDEPEDRLTFGHLLASTKYDDEDDDDEACNYDGDESEDVVSYETLAREVVAHRAVNVVEDVPENIQARVAEQSAEIIEEDLAPIPTPCVAVDDIVEPATQDENDDCAVALVVQDIDSPLIRGTIEFEVPKELKTNAIADLEVEVLHLAVNKIVNERVDAEPADNDAAASSTSPVDKGKRRMTLEDLEQMDVLVPQEPNSDAAILQPTVVEPIAGPNALAPSASTCYSTLTRNEFRAAVDDIWAHFHGGIPVDPKEYDEPEPYNLLDYYPSCGSEFWENVFIAPSDSQDESLSQVRTSTRPYNQLGPSDSFMAYTEFLTNGVKFLGHFESPEMPGTDAVNTGVIVAHPSTASEIITPSARSLSRTSSTSSGSTSSADGSMSSAGVATPDTASRQSGGVLSGLRRVATAIKSKPKWWS